MTSPGSATPVAEEIAGLPPVRGFLHRPPSSPTDGLVLTHGAGSDCRTPLLVSVAEAFAAAGLTVLRCDLPFRQKRRHGPPLGTADSDREGLRAAALALRKLVPGRVFLGGHSYGGRQASMLAAEDSQVTGGLLLLSYPLHPPKKPSQLRTAHFPKLAAAVLFVQGTKDGFSTIEEMQTAMTLLPGKKRLIVVENAGHDLRGLSPPEVVRIFHELTGA